MGMRSVLLAALVLIAPVTASAQNWVIQGGERYFRIDAAPTPTQGRRGPIISGYIYNLYGYTFDNVKVIVEALDGTGRVTNSSVAYIQGTIPAGGRTYFETPAPSGGTTYRVRVGSFDPVGRGGS